MTDRSWLLHPEVLVELREAATWYEHRAAGIGLLKACMEFPVVSRDQHTNAPSIRCPEGEHRMTGAFNLNAKYIIHAVAPINLPPYNEHGLEERLQKLDALYAGIFNEFANMDARSILFPPLGTRSFGMPREESAHIATTHAQNFADDHPDKEIFFTVIDPQEHALYKMLLPPSR